MGKSGNWSSTKNLHNLSLLFHLPSSKNFGATLSFRRRSGVNTGKSHSRRRKEEEIDPTWPDDLEVMLGKILRTYWRWICGRKKQQSQSQRSVNCCHCLCDCYWRKGSKSGNISQIVINIISARKTIVLLHSRSPQMDLQVDARGFPSDSSSSAMYDPRQICTCEKLKRGSKSLLQLHLNRLWSLWSISLAFLCS